LLRETLGSGRHDASKKHWRHRTKNGKVIDVQITSREVIFSGRLAEIVTAEPCPNRSLPVSIKKRASTPPNLLAHSLSTQESLHTESSPTFAFRT